MSNKQAKSYLKASSRYPPFPKRLSSLDPDDSNSSEVNKQPSDSQMADLSMTNECSSTGAQSPPRIRPVLSTLNEGTGDEDSIVEIPQVQNENDAPQQEPCTSTDCAELPIQMDVDENTDDLIESDVYEMEQEQARASQSIQSPKVISPIVSSPLPTGATTQTQSSKNMASPRTLMPPPSQALTHTRFNQNSSNRMRQNYSRVLPAAGYSMASQSIRQPQPTQTLSSQNSATTSKERASTYIERMLRTKLYEHEMQLKKANEELQQHKRLNADQKKAIDALNMTIENERTKRLLETSSYPINNTMGDILIDETRQGDMVSPPMLNNTTMLRSIHNKTIASGSTVEDIRRRKREQIASGFVHEKDFEANQPKRSKLVHPTLETISEKCPAAHNQQTASTVAPSMTIETIQPIAQPSNMMYSPPNKPMTDDCGAQTEETRMQNAFSFWNLEGNKLNQQIECDINRSRARMAEVELNEIRSAPQQNLDFQFSKRPMRKLSEKMLLDRARAQKEELLENRNWKKIAEETAKYEKQASENTKKLYMERLCMDETFDHWSDISSRLSDDSTSDNSRRDLYELNSATQELMDIEPPTTRTEKIDYTIALHKKLVSAVASPRSIDCTYFRQMVEVVERANMPEPVVKTDPMKKLTSILTFNRYLPPVRPE